jgi:hypothetical protein
MIGYYTAGEAAALLGISRAMIYKAQRHGTLPRNKHPRPPTTAVVWVFTDDDLARYRREHRGRKGRKPYALLTAA